MEYNIGFSDGEIETAFLDSKTIINSLQPEQIKEIVMSLGVDRYEETSSAYIFPTICHNADVQEASMKLYYYFNNHVFVCYTECNDAFTIFTLIMRVKQTRGESCSYSEARDYVLSYLNYNTLVYETKRYESVTSKYKKRASYYQLPEYSSNVMNCFIAAPPLSWLKEGMTPEAIQEYNIRCSLSHMGIIIPHYDLDSRLVGIRIRNMQHEQNTDIPKYCPLIMEDKMYNHSLAMNLYGYNLSYPAIHSSHQAILFEGEKSVILHRSYFGKNSNAVAVCGSNISKPQIDLLIKKNRIDEIIIAFDKEFEEYASDECDKYFDKLYSLAKRYTNYSKVSFIIDQKNLLRKKDSPIDRGKDTFVSLFENRVMVN